MTSPDNIKLRWRLEDIDFAAIDPALVRDDDEFLFYMLASASFVEILAGLYSKNLIAHFPDNPDAAAWLEQQWQHEEVQHGRALRAYVMAAWPEFDWERAHAGFVKEYSALCTTQQLEPSRALEMVARCVVETGTSTFYRAVHDYVREPVLVQLLSHIKTDEAGHYTRFRHYFDIYNRTEKHGALAIIGAIWRRVMEIGEEDSYVAFKHVYLARHPDGSNLKTAWKGYNRKVRHHARSYYPYAMAFKMLGKPIPLAAPIKRALEWTLTGLARLASLA